MTDPLAATRQGADDLQSGTADLRQPGRALRARSRDGVTTNPTIFAMISDGDAYAAQLADPSAGGLGGEALRA
jgi:transaldolase